MDSVVFVISKQAGSRGALYGFMQNKLRSIHLQVWIQQFGTQPDVRQENGYGGGFCW